MLEFPASKPTIDEESKVRTLLALLTNSQFNTSTAVVPELYISIHSPPGHAASSYPLGFGIASFKQTLPVHAIALPAVVPSVLSKNKDNDDISSSAVKVKALNRISPPYLSTQFRVFMLS